MFSSIDSYGREIFHLTPTDE
ncbi:hypothetical protein CBM2600_B10417 [Cupriavidus taiwanensis]|nr:hypothetical protein CBM2600_B10417 [Cupriavidus taiwanensis]